MANIVVVSVSRRVWPLLFLVASLAGAVDGEYTAGIQQWRRDFDVEVRTGGWLSLIGRYKVDEGLTTIGSDASSRVTLPPALATKRLGTLLRHGDSFRFVPEPGLKAKLDGHVLVQTALLSTAPDTGRVQVGRLTLSVRAAGADFYLLAADSSNQAIQDFKGTKWFPVDAGFRVAATFAAYDRPESRQLPLTHVASSKPLTSTGEVIFQLGGKTLRLRSFADDDQLFILFQDQTNGKETYGGGRYLYAPLPKDGKTVLDFNKAFSPFCAVNDYVMCPIPPPENRLDVRIAAGETYVP